MKLSIKIDKEIYELLRRIKEKEGATMTYSLNTAVIEYANKKGVN